MQLTKRVVALEIARVKSHFLAGRTRLNRNEVTRQRESLPVPPRKLGASASAARGNLTAGLPGGTLLIRRAARHFCSARRDVGK